MQMCIKKELRVNCNKAEPLFEGGTPDVLGAARDLCLKTF